MEEKSYQQQSELVSFTIFSSLLTRQFIESFEIVRWGAACEVNKKRFYTDDESQLCVFFRMFLRHNCAILISTSSSRRQTLHSTHKVRDFNLWHFDEIPQKSSFSTIFVDILSRSRQVVFYIYGNSKLFFREIVRQKNLYFFSTTQLCRVVLCWKPATLVHVSSNYKWNSSYTFFSLCNSTRRSSWSVSPSLRKFASSRWNIGNRSAIYLNF